MMIAKFLVWECGYSHQFKEPDHNSTFNIDYILAFALSVGRRVCISRINADSL